MDIKQAATEYLKSIKRLTPRTQKGYRQRLTVFIEWCEEHHIELAEIRNVAVDDFVEHLRKNHHSAYHNRKEISSHTTAGYVRVLKCFLAFCLDDDTYSQQVIYATVKRIRLPKRTKNVVDIFSEQDIRALFAACNQEFDIHLQERDRAILAVLIDTGVRAAELCTLTREHTHLENGDPHIRVRGKNDKWREVGLGRFSREALQHYISTYRAEALPTDAVFIGRYNSQKLTVSGLEHMIHRLAMWSKIENVRCSPHTFRHSFAVRYLLAGGDIFKLSLLMGHEDTRVTSHYLRTVQAMQIRRDVSSVLDGMNIS